MNFIEFACLVRAMRHHQRRYFKNRFQADMQLAKDYERRVDEELGSLIRAKPGEMFDNLPDSQPTEGPYDKRNPG